MKSIDELKNDTGEIERESIKEIIPYNDSFLMIDKVKDLAKDKIVAIKEVKPDEPYLNGHFVDFPIMPGALIVEGIGQAGTLLIRYNLENHWEKDCLAYKIQNAKFSSPTFPGDTLTYEVSLLGLDDRGGLLSAKALNGEKVVCEAQMIVAVVDKKQFRGGQ